MGCVVTTDGMFCLVAEGPTYSTPRMASATGALTVALADAALFAMPVIRSPEAVIDRRSSRLRNVNSVRANSTASAGCTFISAPLRPCPVKTAKPLKASIDLMKVAA
jgi:hypothetical protein